VPGVVYEANYPGLTPVCFFCAYSYVIVLLLYADSEVLVKWLEQSKKFSNLTASTDYKVCKVESSDGLMTMVSVDSSST